MKHFTVGELSMDNYKTITVEVVGGTRPRLTLIHKDSNQKFFFKTYSHNPREVWAECLASHIAELMGLKAQAVTIKKTSRRLENILRQRFPDLPADWKPVGSLSRNIFPRNIEIVYGGSIVETPTEPLTLAQVEEKIREKYYAPDDLLQSYADMTIFDILTGNMDRHHENWGICEDKKYKQQVLIDRRRVIGLRYFTPLFDHGSSLMFELGQDKVLQFTEDESRLIRYVEESSFGFILNINGDRSNMFKIIEEHLEQNTPWGSRFKKSLEKVKEIDLLTLGGLVLKMPTLDLLEYDSIRRSLLYKALLLRYTKLINLL